MRKLFFLFIQEIDRSLIIQDVSKKCPGNIWYVNDNLIYAHVHRLPHVEICYTFY